MPGQRLLINGRCLRADYNWLASVNADENLDDGRHSGKAPKRPPAKRVIQLLNPATHLLTSNALAMFS